MSKFQANINDTVEVVLTTTGAKIYNDVHAVYISIGVSDPKKEGDILRAQLWRLFQDFEDHIYLGMREVPFKDCKIGFV
mgnify:FL=1